MSFSKTTKVHRTTRSQTSSMSSSSSVAIKTVMKSRFLSPEEGERSGKHGCTHFIAQEDDPVSTAKGMGSSAEFCVGGHWTVPAAAIACTTETLN